MSDTFFFMRPYCFDLWLGGGDTYEVLLKVQVKSVLDEEKLRQSRSDWRTTGAKSAPLQSGGYSDRNWRKSAPVALPTGATSGSGHYTEPALSDRSGASSEAKSDLGTELKEIREWITETAREMEVLDAVLAPVWQLENGIKDSIRRTHGDRLYDPAGAPARRPCFEDLLQVSVQWGKVKNERRETARQLKAYEREADRLEREIARKRRKTDGKNGDASGKQ